MEETLIYCTVAIITAIGMSTVMIISRINMVARMIIEETAFIGQLSIGQTQFIADVGIDIMTLSKAEARHNIEKMKDTALIFSRISRKA